MPGPLLGQAQLAELRGRLSDSGYTVEAVLARLGAAAGRGLERNSTMPAREALGTDGDPQATLIRLWILQDAVPWPAVAAALGPLAAVLVDARLLDASAAPLAGRTPSGLADPGVASAPGSTNGGGGYWVRARAVIRPYGAEATPLTPEVSGWICHDPLPNLDGRSAAPRADHVLGVSPASTTLAQLTIRHPVGSALDLGTGCGVQSLHLAAHAQRVVATDLSPRALSLASVTTGLSQVAAELRLGSLYAPVADERFDLITSNPPFVISPPGASRFVYREGDLPGDELVRRVVVEGAARLTPGGTMQVLCNWAILDGQPWDERLAGWLRPTGCDALVLQRETLDPFEYVEVWLSDAGLDGASDHARRYRDWLDYLAALRITGIGLGWISLRNAGRAVPDLRLEHWPFDVHQPLGEALAAQQRAVDLTVRDDAALLATAWQTVPGVVQETLGRPGAEDPEHIVLRQSTGLGRATEADTGLAALVGACDGDLTASEIIHAIASLLDVDADALAADLTPRLRTLVSDGYLTA